MHDILHLANQTCPVNRMATAQVDKRIINRTMVATVENQCLILPG